MTLVGRVARALAAAMLASAVALAQPPGRAVAVEAPMACRHGPDSRFSARVTAPASAPAGARVAVRIDSVSSGRLDHLGLLAIHDMTSDYRVPAGARYVQGSARVVPGTGTANVRGSARAWADDAGIHLALPARVENGSGYTPPSLEFAVTLEAAPGSQVALQFVHASVAVDAFLIGTLVSDCQPSAGPLTLATVRVEGLAGADGGR